MQEKIYLRSLSLNDITEKYLFWVNNRSVTEYLEIGKQRIEHDDLVKYIKDSPKNGRYNYAIITQNSEHHIGNGSLHSIDVNSKNFTIGWFVGEKEFWGGHYSSLTIFNLLKIGFIDMGLEKCIGAVNKNHIKARMTNNFSGFKELETRFVEIDNKKNTLINLEITKKEWLARAKILHSQFPALYDEY